eukprot:COSAG02_NODE_50_length_44860_cov_203.992739_4_plen_132_part_00
MQVLLHGQHHTTRQGREADVKRDRAPSAGGRARTLQLCASESTHSRAAPRRVRFRGAVRALHCTALHCTAHLRGTQLLGVLHQHLHFSVRERRRGIWLLPWRCKVTTFSLSLSSCGSTRGLGHKIRFRCGC